MLIVDGWVQACVHLPLPKPFMSTLLYPIDKLLLMNFRLSQIFLLALLLHQARRPAGSQRPTLHLGAHVLSMVPRSPVTWAQHAPGSWAQQ
jgi:hypothetical protein